MSAYRHFMYNMGIKERDYDFGISTEEYAENSFMVLFVMVTILPRPTVWGLELKIHLKIINVATVNQSKN